MGFQAVLNTWSACTYLRGGMSKSVGNHSQGSTQPSAINGVRCCMYAARQSFERWYFVLKCTSRMYTLQLTTVRNID